MLIKNVLATGAAVGAGIAAVMIALDNINLGRISIPLSEFIDRAIFRVCPLYALGFSSSMPNKAVWFLVTILGNAILYALIFGFIGVLWNLLSRRATNP